MKYKDKIDKVIKAIQSAHGKVKYDKILIGVQAEFLVARRTAVDYLDVALYKLKIKKGDLGEK